MFDTNSTKVNSENLIIKNNPSSMNIENTRLVRRMQAATFIVPLLIITLIIVASFVIQNFIVKQDDNTTLVNISGRQCMLSQRITKYSFYLTTTREGEQSHIKSLKESLSLFKESHQNLIKKSNTLSLAKDYQLSSTVHNLYDSLEPYYQGIVKGVDDLLVANLLNNSVETTEKLKIHFAKIEQNENAFLPIMNAIVEAYDKEGHAKIARLRFVQITLSSLVILFGLSLTIFVWRPMVKKVQKAFIDVEEGSKKLATQNEELQSLNTNLFMAQRESEEKQQLLNHAEEIAQMGSFNLDLETNAYSYSENLTVIFGLPESKMTSPKRHLKYVHPDEKSKIEKSFLELVQGKCDTISTTIHFKGENHTNWKFLKLELYLLRDINTIPLRILGVTQDVTETETDKRLIEKSQKQLQEQQLLLQDAEKMATMGSYVWNMKTNFIQNSENLPIIYGFPKEKLIDREAFAQITHPEDWMQNKIALEKILSQKEETLLVTYRARNNKSQEWRYYKSFAFLKYDENREPVMLVGTVQDITEDVLKNQKMELLLEEVSQNKSYLDEAQNLAKIVSYDVNIASKQIKWSKSFADVFDTFPQHIPTNIDDFQTWIAEEDLEKANKNWARSITSKSSFNETYRINTPKGNIFYIRERGHPVFDEQGNFVSIRGTFQDITQSQLAKKEIERKTKQIENQNTKFVASINYAQRIQSAMLGGTQDINTTFTDGFIFFEPKDIVSGDFYWYVQLDENRKVAIVGDCTGHGVPGAFMSLLGATILSEIILQRQITTPSKILDGLQKQIKHILKQDSTGNRDGMDIAVVVVDKSIGTLEFAGAKNPLVYIHKTKKEGGTDANLTVIKGDNLSIGGRKAKAEEDLYTNHIVKLEDIEAFYLYSDGYQDQFGGEEGGKFMSNKFRQLLYDTHSQSMRQQRVSLKRTLMNWMGTENEQIDDICVMGITV